MLIILDANPIKVAGKIPKSMIHKQFLELMQMLSCIVNLRVQISDKYGVTY